MKYRFIILYAIGLLLATTNKLVAQQLSCGTITPDSTESAKFAESLKQEMVYRTNSGLTDTVYYVPLKVHIIRQSNGEVAISDSMALAHLTFANKHFAGAGIQFYLVGEFHYIDSDEYFNYKYAENWPFITEHKEEGAMNIFYPYSIDTGWDGFAGFVPFAYVVVSGYLSEPSTLIHELGHAFGLSHTHRGVDGDPAYRELVDGSNCEQFGDAICDTPADPLGLPGAEGDCINGYTGTAVDFKGQLYTPPFDNFMSYWMCHYSKQRFTFQQLQRIRLVYENYFGSSGLYPFQNIQETVTPPSVLSASFHTEVDKPSFVHLTWQDNSTNEASFFIERSVFQDHGFYSVGFSEKNKTSFVDKSIEQNQTYYYRIRPSNSKHAFSNVVRLQMPSFYCVPSAEPCLISYQIINSFLITSGNSTILNGNRQDCASYSLISLPGSKLKTENQYKISLKMGNHYELFATVWIDYNRNNQFDEEEVIYASDSATNEHSSLFSIPANLENGIYRLRLRTEVGQTDANTPCTAEYHFGEVRDIDFNINRIATGVQNEVQNPDIRLYPNPADDQLNIIIPDSSPWEKIEILDMKGIKLAEKRYTNENSVSLSTQNLAEGFYVIRFITSIDVFSKRIVIKR